MLQFAVRGDGRELLHSCVCTRTPFVIGRSSASDLCVDAPGVWESHAQIDRDGPSGKMVIHPLGEAMILANGERSSSRILVPGDEICLGAVVLEVSLSPVRQKAVAQREAAVWLLLAIVTLAELVLILKY